MQHDQIKIQRALLSVSDKAGLVEFAKALAPHGVELLDARVPHEPVLAHRRDKRARRGIGLRGLARRPRLSPPSVPLITGVTDEDLAALWPWLTERRLRKGEVLFREGDPGDEMFLIRSGTVVISKRVTGRVEHVLARGEAGDFTGEMILFVHLPRSATIQAESAAVLLGLISLVGTRRRVRERSGGQRRDKPFRSPPEGTRDRADTGRLWRPCQGRGDQTGFHRDPVRTGARV